MLTVKDTFMFQKQQALLKCFPKELTLSVLGGKEQECGLLVYLV